jgi:C-terminal processing protease CtpA/Prc
MKILTLFIAYLISFTAFGQNQYNQIEEVPAQPGGTPSTIIRNLAGIAAVVAKEKESKRIIIKEVIPNGPAEKAGVIAGDEIIQVDSAKTEGMALKDIINLLRGDPGTVVTVTLKRGIRPEPIALKITRDIIKLPDVPSKQ